jgi:tetratricopeptide (TPR) repeat protein
MKSRTLQILLVLGTVILTVGLALSPSQVNMKPNSNKSAPKANSAQSASQELNADALLKSAKSALTKEQIAQLDQLELGLKVNGEKDTAVLDQIGRFWDRQGIPAASAVWFEKKSEVQKTEKSYLDAAYRYFDSFKLAQDSGLKDLFVAKAISNYTKVLDLNPDNLDAKTDLGACYAEGTGEPMKGIMLLRDVVSKNPNHEMAQYNLGMLSVRSGQFDKAIERFKKVLEINPQRTQLYYYLGQIYLQEGDTTKALESYKSFMKKSEDYEAVSQVGQMVKELEKSSPAL